MPRDKIAEHAVHNETNGKLEIYSTVELTWHRDAETVQLALTATDGDETSQLYSRPLNRHQINTLIRSLRRARDQVFGRDE